jgi:acyl-CoA thioester hydrolase
MFTCTVSPRFGETDALGHINNTALANWFELARNPLFPLFSIDVIRDSASMPLIMAHTDFDFVGEIQYGTDVEIRTFVERIGTKSFTLYHEAWQDGRLCTTGHAVIVYFDFRAHASVPIPEDKKKLLAEHLKQ